MNVETIIKQRTDWLYQAKVVEEDVIKIYFSDETINNFKTKNKIIKS